MSKFEFYFFVSVAFVASLSRVEATDFATRSIVAIGGAISNLIVDINRSKLARYADTVDAVEDNFWTDAIKNKNKHFNQVFAEELERRFNVIFEKDRQNPDLMDLFHAIQERMMQQGAQHFKKQAKQLDKVVQSELGLKTIRGNVFEDSDHMVSAEELAQKVSQQLGVQPAESLEEYRELVFKHYKCDEFEAALKPMKAYQDYLELAAYRKEYYNYTPFFQVKNVKVLMACHRLKGEYVLEDATTNRKPEHSK